MEINLPNNYFKDAGVKSIVKGIPTHNHLKRLHFCFSDCNLCSKSGVSIGKLFGKLKKVEDLEVDISWNEEFKDQGVKKVVQGIPTHNHLKKLGLNFSDCNLSQKSGDFLKEMFPKLTKVEDLAIHLNDNFGFKE